MEDQPMRNKKRLDQYQPIKEDADHSAIKDLTAKIDKPKQISIILEYFRNNIGTSLDAAIATHILRNSVTWIICQLEDLGMIQAINRKPDQHTHRKAKHYSANRELWHHGQPQQLQFNFDE